MISNQDRRKYKRINRPFLSRFRVHAILDDGEVSSRWRVVTLENLGAGGALINFNKKIDLGTPVDMVINFHMSKEPINCNGKVVRIERTKILFLYRIAVKFENIENNNKENINKFAENIFKSRPELIAS